MDRGVRCDALQTAASLGYFDVPAGGDPRTHPFEVRAFVFERFAELLDELILALWHDGRDRWEGNGEKDGNTRREDCGPRRTRGGERLTGRNHLVNIFRKLQ